MENISKGYARLVDDNWQPFRADTHGLGVLKRITWRTSGVFLWLNSREISPRGTGVTSRLDRWNECSTMTHLADDNAYQQTTRRLKRLRGYPVRRICLVSSRRFLFPFFLFVCHRLRKNDDTIFVSLCFLCFLLEYFFLSFFFLCFFRLRIIKLKLGTFGIILNILLGVT